MARVQRRRTARAGSISYSIAQGSGGPQVRRAMQMLTTKNDHGEEFEVGRTKMRLRIGSGLRRGPRGEIEAKPQRPQKFTRVDSIRDKSGGTAVTSGEIAAVTDVPTAANAIATLAAQVEKLRKSLLGEI